MKNGTLLRPDARAQILRRIEALTPESERRWGRMTAHQMVCHLSDACRAALGERRVPVIGTLWERTVIRWLAIHTNVSWPQGVRTVPEADQDGNRPPAIVSTSCGECGRGVGLGYTLRNMLQYSNATVINSSLM